VLLSWRSYCHVLLIGLLAGSFYNCMTPMLASHCYPWWRGWSHTLWLTLIRLWLPILVLLDFDLLDNGYLRHAIFILWIFLCNLIDKCLLNSCHGGLDGIGCTIDEIGWKAGS
jgi:hypothetical protein